MLHLSSVILFSVQLFSSQKGTEKIEQQPVIPQQETSKL